VIFYFYLKKKKNFHKIKEYIPALFSGFYFVNSTFCIISNMMSISKKEN